MASAPLLIRSFDFASIAEQQAGGAWPALARTLADAALGLERQGADAILICTNTMHKIYDGVASAVSVPVLHIADATGRALRAQGVRRPLLLATRFAMEEPFLVERLSRHDCTPFVPDVAERRRIHSIIYEELCRGRIDPRSRAELADLVDRYARRGADGVILGCTEIGLLLCAKDLALPVFDTTALHVAAALDFACAPDPAAAA